MKKLHIWIILLTILFSMATIVEAKDKYTYRTDHWEAFADWSLPSGSIYIHVVKSDVTDDIFPAQTDIYVSQSSPNNYLSGYKYTTGDVFDMDGQLDTATLSPVRIDMYNFAGAYIKTIEIQSQWTGIGSIQKENNDVKFYYRNATATMSIDGTDLGQTIYAKLERYEGVYK